MKNLLPAIIGVVSLALVAWCAALGPAQRGGARGAAAAPAMPALAAAPAASADKTKPAKADTVRRIELPEAESSLPEAPGRDVVVIVCGTCHSGRYITMQPNFPREAWVAQIDKMKKTYGAPVPPENEPAILEYLVAIRGTKPAAK